MAVAMFTFFATHTPSLLEFSKYVARSFAGWVLWITGVVALFGADMFLRQIRGDWHHGIDEHVLPYLIVLVSVPAILVIYNAPHNQSVLVRSFSLVVHGLLAYVALRIFEIFYYTAIEL